MIYEVIAANLKNYIDATGAAQELTPEKSVFQLSVGGKKDKYGWHFIVYDGDCQFKRGLYSGEIFIDWNDEFKYREKSKKQIIRETTPDYEVNFKDGAEFEAFVAAAGQYLTAGGKKPKLRGSKLSGAKCDIGEFGDVLIRCFALQSATALSFADNDDKRLAARMALFSLAEAIKILGREGNDVVREFAAGSRRSFFFDTAEGGRATWLTVHDGLIKVTANQGTRLPALCGLEFDSDESALRFVHSFFEQGDRPDVQKLFEAAYRFKGAATYGIDADDGSIEKGFREVCIAAAEALKMNV